MTDKKEDTEAPLAKRANDQMKRFRRLESRKWVGGVCSGLAYRLGIPTWLVRLVWVVLILCKGIGLVPYILLWIFVPPTAETPPDYTDRTGDS